MRLLLVEDDEMIGGPVASRLYIRSEVEDKLYGWGEEISSNAIEVHIQGLRRKIGSDQIATVRGVGYRIKRCE
ncbi:Transcriptional regulatory protein, C terminal [Paraburkholderia steynii]|uniref:Transcriptional regulatory protein, C terminal n=1 Tax=Paraburkholderia steynii TaxID=1245441 RepID=A0A7Z7FHD0_9BURK|nr:Transcriptional regulatory protein, C terminal [Paraburkholderia steynii]